MLPRIESLLWAKSLFVLVSVVDIVSRKLSKLSIFVQSMPAGWVFTLTLPIPSEMFCSMFFGQSGFLAHWVIERLFHVALQKVGSPAWLTAEESCPSLVSLWSRLSTAIFAYCTCLRFFCFFHPISQFSYTYSHLLTLIIQSSHLNVCCTIHIIYG